MKIERTTLAGVLVVVPEVHRDERGAFAETYRHARYLEAGIAAGREFVQDNLSTSARDVVRGLHYRLDDAEGKLVTVAAGEVFDVVVDLRPGSPTHGAWFGTRLSARDHRQVWIPPGCAHGFAVTSPEAVVAYKVTAAYAPWLERTIAWDDPQLAIPWPLAGAAIVSARDAAAPRLRDAELPGRHA